MVRLICCKFNLIFKTMLRFWSENVKSDDMSNTPAYNAIYYSFHPEKYRLNFPYQFIKSLRKMSSFIQKLNSDLKVIIKFAIHVECIFSNLFFFAYIISFTLWINSADNLFSSLIFHFINNDKRMSCHSNEIIVRWTSRLNELNNWKRNWLHEN